MQAQYGWVNDAANGPTATFHNLFDTINPALGLGQGNATLKAKIVANYCLYQQFDNFLPSVSDLVNGQNSPQIGDDIVAAIKNAAKGFAAIGLVARDLNEDLSQALKTGLTPLEIGKAIDPKLSDNRAIHLAMSLGSKVDTYARGKMAEWAGTIKTLTGKYVQCYQAELKAAKAAELNNILNLLFNGIALLLGSAASLTSTAMQFGRTLSVSRNEYKLTTIFQNFKAPNTTRMYSDEQVQLIVNEFKGLKPAQARAKFDSMNMCKDPNFPVTANRKPGWLSGDGPDFTNLGLSNYNLDVGANADKIVQTGLGLYATNFSYRTNDFLNSSKDGYDPQNKVNVAKLSEVAAHPAYAKNLRHMPEFAGLSRRVTEAITQLVNVGGAGEIFTSWGEFYGVGGHTGISLKDGWYNFLKKIGVTAAVSPRPALNWRGNVYVLQTKTENQPGSYGATVTNTIKKMATPF